jgi:hypothetical protein
VNGGGHYQIDYPSVANPTSLDSFGVRIDFRESFNTGTNEGLDEFGVTVTVHSNPQNQPLDDWIRAVHPDPSLIRTRIAVSINDLPGYTLTAADQDQVFEETYLSSRDGAFMYRIAYWKPETMFDFPPAVRATYRGMFERMLHSFRLVAT